MFEKRIISFQVGAGGNFLANFLSDDDVNVEADFRIDWPRQKNPLIASFAPVTLDELVVADFLRKVDEWTKQTKTQTLITHYRNISNFIKYKDSCWFRKIVPGKHILTYCKNVWYKKRELDIEALSRVAHGVHARFIRHLFDGRMFLRPDGVSQHEVRDDEADQDRDEHKDRHKSHKLAGQNEFLSISRAAFRRAP